jgi:alpha-glucosidase (family GH31 glycosyl hydrolase)
MRKIFSIKYAVIFYILILSVTQITAQILDVSPGNPDSSSDVVIVFDASLGNAALFGYTGDVYAHTGLISTESQNGNDWKHVVGNWGQADNKVLMNRIGDDLYRISFNIADFYGLQDNDENILQMAFVFRNEDGSLVGRSESGNDIFYSINIDGPGDYVYHSWNEGELDIVTTAGRMKVSPYNPEIIKLSFVKENQQAFDSSYTVIMENRHPLTDFDENGEFLQLTTDSLKIIINKYPINIEFWKENKLLCDEEIGFYNQTDNNGVRFFLEENEQIQGAGSRAIPINRRSFKLMNYGQAHYGYGNGEQNLNISIPFLTSSKSYGLFFDNHSKGNLDIAYSQSDILDVSATNNEMVYYFISSATYDGILENYTLLTGRQPLPPLWCFGYFQSRFGYENESHARQMLTDMQAGGFPMDVIILDLYWFGNPGTMGNLSWDYSKWHNPIKMIYDFKQAGVKTILISEPYITKNSFNYNFVNQNNWFGERSSGESYLLEDFWAGPASLMDFTKKESLDWMWNFYSTRKSEGVAGWWSDLGEPENHPDDMFHKGGSATEVHNILPLLWAQSLYLNYSINYPEERLFNLSRSGYAGMQRYSTFPWSGDIQKTWSGFQAQIPVLLGMGMSGVAYMGSDLGGFVGDFNPELYTRWMQEGCFSPIMRAHGINVVTEPVYLSEPYKTIVRDVIKLRYKMLPYNYTLAWQNTLSGRPLALPMDYFDKENNFLNNINDQYFWGEQLLVAPVMEEGGISRTVIFPAGNWIDFKTNQTYSGEHIYSVDAPLDKIPVFVKGGSFLPLTNPLMSTDDYKTDTLLVCYYPDNSNPNTNYSIYMDDGLSASSLEDGSYEIVSFNGEVELNTILIDMHKEGEGFENSPLVREMMFEIKRVNNEPLNVLIDNAEIEIVNNIDDYLSIPKASYFNTETHVLMLHFNWDGFDTHIEIKGSGVGMEEVRNKSFKSIVLHDAVPNPFSYSTSLNLDITHPGIYFLSVHDIYGKEVFNKQFYFSNKGRSTINWDGRDLYGNAVENGTYIVVVQNGNGEKAMQKTVLIR